MKGWHRLTPPIDIQDHRRVGLLEYDLALLGVHVPTGVLSAQLLDLSSLARCLGCLYVLEGAASGGRIIARRARIALGADLPVSFFTGAVDDDFGAGWRALQRRIDSYGATHGPGADRDIISAVTETSAALRRHLGVAAVG